MWKHTRHRSNFIFGGTVRKEKRIFICTLVNVTNTDVLRGGILYCALNNKCLVLFPHPLCEMNSWLHRCLLGSGTSVALLKRCVFIKETLQGVWKLHCSNKCVFCCQMERAWDSAKTLMDQSSQSLNHTHTQEQRCRAASCFTAYRLTFSRIRDQFISHRYRWKGETSVTWRESSWRGSDEALSSCTGFSGPYRQPEGKRQIKNVCRYLLCWLTSHTHFRFKSEYSNASQ